MASPKRKSLVYFRYSLEFLVLAIFNVLLFILPWSITWRLGRGLGWLGYQFFTKRKACYLHWGEGFISTLKLWMVSKRKSRSIVEAPGFDEFVLAAQQANEPIIYFTGHFGSWEMAGRYAGGIGPGAASIYRIQKNPMVDWFLTWIREFHHLKLINSWSGMSAFEDALKRYTGLAVVGDQFKKKNGLTVDFFNIPSATPKGAAILTFRVHPRLVFLSCTQHRGRYRLRIEELAYDLPETLNDEWMQDITQQLTSKLEAEIRRYPEQYFWFHRRWRDLDRQEAQDRQS